MRVLGVHVQTAAGRYKTHFAVVVNGELTEQATKTAPVGNNEARQVEELVAFTEQLLDEHGIDFLAFRQTESAGTPRPMSQLATTFHAEGAVLVAAGRHGVPHTTIARATMGSVADDDSRMKAVDATRILCDRLGGPHIAQDRAAAAAVALCAELQGQ